jgi:hypothetical protein
MSLGELKGISLAYPDEKEKFYESLRSKNFVEEVFDYGNFGFCLKVKNPIYSYSWQYGGLFHPVISGFSSDLNNGKTDNHKEGCIFAIPITRKYFHDVLEVMPLILTLKEKHENFKVVLNSHEKEEDGIFPSFNLNPKDASPQRTGESLKYWIDFLTEFNINYECVNVNSIQENYKFSADYGYVFYYSDYGLGIDKSEYMHNTTGLKGNVRQFNGINESLIFKHTYEMSPLLYFTNLIFADSYEILKRNFKPFIKKTIPGKKVFITRDSSKFPDRSILNSENLTEYMRNKGFEIVNQEEMSFKDQISYITEAECVVSLVGSSFINVMFCNKESNIFTIHTDKSQDFNLYLAQAARYDIDTKVIYCDPDGLDIIDYFESSSSKAVLRWIHG